MSQPDAPLTFPFPPAPSLYEPTTLLGELREQRPVAKVRMPNGSDAWIVTGYPEVRQVLMDQRFSRAAAAAPEVQQTGLAKLATETIIGMDPPEHTRLRRLVARAFTARRVEELRPGVVQIVDELLTSLKALPQPADLVSNFSLPLPVQVICELLGVPAADRHIFHEWSDTLVGDWQRDPTEMEQALAALSDYFADLIAAKRAQPQDDLMTALIAARDEQDKLSERELVLLGLSLLIGGHETTANQLNMILLTLRRYPEEMDRLRADPGLVPQAVEELMRFVQLGDGGAGMPRVATEEVELGGVRLPAGAVVMTASVTANRDPSMYPDPDRLDLTRTDSPHLGFGAGIHHCLGAPLSRMELQEALRGLLRHVPDMRIAIPDEALRFKPGMLLRSLESLPVTW